VLSPLVNDLMKIKSGNKNSIFGKVFPDENNEIFAFKKIFKPKDLLKELNWLVLSVKFHKQDLIDFLKEKSEFEKAFLIGKYNICHEILEKVFKKFGYSFWYIEQKFLVLEFENRSEEQKLFLSELNKTNNNIGGLYSHFLCQRTERNLSAYKYDYDIKNLFKRDKEDFYQNASRSFYKYTLNYYEYLNPENLIHIVSFSKNLPIFDRYFVLLNVFKSLFLDKLHLEFVVEKSIYLYRKVKDTSLLNLILPFVPNFKFEKSFINLEYIQILDYYYIGNYNKCIEKIIEYFKTSTVSVEILKIYAKSTISIGKPFEIVFPENSIAHNISNSIYKILSNPNDKLILDKLYTTHKNLFSFELSGSLNYFLKIEQNIEISEESRFLFLNHLSPFLTKIMYSDDLKDEYFQMLDEFLPSSISISYLKSVSQRSLILNSAISPEIRKIDECEILFSQGEYSNCVEKSKEIINLFHSNPPIVQKATRLIFESEVNLEHFNDAIDIYVSQYLKDNISVNKIKPQILLDCLRGRKYKGVRRTLKLPIFLSLTSNDDAEKAFILESVISIYGCQLPSQMFDKISFNQETEVFYYMCSTSEILKHYIYLNKTLTRLEERQKILNYLLQNDTDLKKFYSSQLDHITNEIIIYEGTRKLDESKIYANDQAIIENELNEVEGLFSRFKTIYKIISKNKSVILLSADSYQFITISPNSSQKENDTKYTDYALLEVFTEIFDLVLQKYLFSKFGIVAYLSTRIRHGVLGGEIRPEIDKHHLILNKKANSVEYLDSTYWSKPYYGLNTLELKKLNEILSKFSLIIDSIIEEILKRKIQIRSAEHNPDGLFNYEFSKYDLNEMAYKFANEENVKVFCQKIIDKIWERTDFNLEVIRDYFENDVSHQFHKAFTGLENDIKSNFNDKLSDIHTEIIDCNTIINNRLIKIGEWFKRTGSTLDNFDLNNLFGIIWQNTEKCYPNGHAELNIEKHSSFPLIESRYYIHFTDLFRIFIDNMFKYCAIENGKKIFNIRIEKDEERFIAQLQNNTTKENCSFFTNNSVLDFDDSKLIVEKKSGISKAIKIIKYDLNDKSNCLHTTYEPIDEEKDIFRLKITLTINLKNLKVYE